MHNTKGLHLALKRWSLCRDTGQGWDVVCGILKKNNKSQSFAEARVPSAAPVSVRIVLFMSWWLRRELPNSQLALFVHETQFNVKLEQESRGWYEEDSYFCGMFICTLLWLMRSQNNDAHQTCWRRNMLLHSCWLRSPSYWNLEAQSIVGKAGHFHRHEKLKMETRKINKTLTVIKPDLYQSHNTVIVTTGPETLGTGGIGPKCRHHMLSGSK